jgi:hypothetical protein
MAKATLPHYSQIPTEFIVREDLLLLVPPVSEVAPGILGMERCRTSLDAIDVRGVCCV